MLPRLGDVLLLDRAVSVQFTRPILFRVVRCRPWTTYEGWKWIDGFELNAAGDAVERRDVWVQLHRLRMVPQPINQRPKEGRRKRNNALKGA